MRRSSYKRAYCDKVIEYFTEMLEKRDQKGLIKTIPSYVGFAKTIGVTTRTLENWRKQYKNFGEACDECDALLQATIIGEGLSFRMHASFAKFILSSRYGMREKVEISRDSEEMIVPKVLEELLAQRARREQK